MERDGVIETLMIEKYHLQSFVCIIMVKKTDFGIRLCGFKLWLYLLVG